MDEQMKQFIGTGWKFPIEFDSSSGNVVMMSGEDIVKNSLDVLFATNAGERIMQPDYGTDLADFVFDNISKSAITYMQAIISDAILFYEPRIILNEVEIERMDSDPAYLEIRIDYTISSTNNRYNYVYTFYLREGTNLTR